MYSERNNIQHEYVYEKTPWFRIQRNMSLTNWNPRVSNDHAFPPYEISTRVFHSYCKFNLSLVNNERIHVMLLKWCLLNNQLWGLVRNEGTASKKWGSLHGRHYHRKSTSEEGLMESRWVICLEDARCIAADLAGPKEKCDKRTPNTQRCYKCWVIATFQHNPSQEWCHILWYILSWCLALLYSTENMQTIRENISVCVCMCETEQAGNRNQWPLMDGVRSNQLHITRSSQCQKFSEWQHLDIPI